MAHPFARAPYGTIQGTKAQAKSSNGRKGQRAQGPDLARGPAAIVPPPPPPPRPSPRAASSAVPSLPGVGVASAVSPVQVTYKTTPRPPPSFLGMLHAALVARDGEEAVTAAYLASGYPVKAGPRPVVDRSESPIGDRIRAA